MYPPCVYKRISTQIYHVTSKTADLPFLLARILPLMSLLVDKYRKRSNIQVDSDGVSFLAVHSA